MARIDRELEVYDSLTAEEAELAQEYGLKQALLATRQFYGRIDKARALLEANRKALQVQRYGIITKPGPSG